MTPAMRRSAALAQSIAEQLLGQGASFDDLVSLVAMMAAGIIDVDVEEEGLCEEDAFVRFARRVYEIRRACPRMPSLGDA